MLSAVVAKRCCGSAASPASCSRRGIDTVVAQRLNRGTHQRTHGRRIEDVLVLKPLFLQMCTRGELVFDNLDKARGRTAVYIDAGI